MHKKTINNLFIYTIVIFFIVISFLIIFFIENLVLKVLIALALLLVIILTYDFYKKMQLLKMGKKISQYLDDAIILTNQYNKIVYANESFLKMVGYNFDEIKGRNPSIFKGGFHSKEFYTSMWNDLNIKGFWEGELIDKRKDNTFFIKRVKIVAVYDKNKIKYYFSIQRNVDYIKKLEKEKKRYLYRNVETLLPNEQYFVENASKIINKDSKIFYCKILNRTPIETMIGKKNYLKAILYFFGGLKSTIKNDGIIAEFDRESLVILVDSMNFSNQILINKILNLSQNLVVDNYQISLDVRIGIAGNDINTNMNTTELLSNAFVALNEAIESKDMLFSIYQQTMKAEVNKEFEMQIELKKAITEKKLTLFYQPQINTTTNKIIGVEALIRWFSDKWGYIPPNEFLPIAEKYGYMSKIDDFIIDTIMKDAKEIAKLNENIKISINVNLPEFINRRFIQRLVKKANLENFPLNILVIELNEGQALKDDEKLVKAVNDSKLHGIEISLDDFGTGYNSLKTLSIIPIDEIKIDKSFIDNFPDRTFTIVQSIVTLAKVCNKRIIVEGVETEEQNNALKKIGCDNIQGYLFAKPMPINKLRNWTIN